MYGRRFDRFSALSKLLDLQLGEMGVWAYLCFGRRFKRIWVNGGGVLWKEKGASDQDFACNLEVVTIQPWLVHCGQGSTILALPSSSLLYTIIHHFSSPATQIEEVHYWRNVHWGWVLMSCRHCILCFVTIVSLCILSFGAFTTF